MEKQISRNDYFNMLRETGRVPKSDEYKIIPLDLSQYHLSEVTKRIADNNFMEETKNSRGNYMLCGHWLDDLCFQFAAKCGFNLHQVDAYNAYAYSDEQMAIFTYCEGDISLTPFSEKGNYEAEKKETIHFYEKVY